jgi:hypothetical protein
MGPQRPHHFQYCPFGQLLLESCLHCQHLAHYNQDKYLGSKPLLHWLRKQPVQLTRASSFWKGLVNSSAVIQHWLCWLPGEGREIQLRQRCYSWFRGSIITFNSDADTPSVFKFLYSCPDQNRVAASLLPDDWLSASDLHLSEPLTSEWNCYTLALKGAGISLKTEPDVLSWAGGDGSG